LDIICEGYFFILYTLNKKRSEESSRNVCNADLEDSLEKEELYLRKIKIFDA
jgi:hypothetical protein